MGRSEKFLHVAVPLHIRQKMPCHAVMFWTSRRRYKYAWISWWYSWNSVPVVYCLFFFLILPLVLSIFCSSKMSVQCTATFYSLGHRFFFLNTCVFFLYTNCIGSIVSLTLHTSFTVLSLVSRLDTWRHELSIEYALTQHCYSSMERKLLMVK